MIVSGYLFKTEDCLDLLVFTCCFQQGENVPAGTLVCFCFGTIATCCCFPNKVVWMNLNLRERQWSMHGEFTAGLLKHRTSQTLCVSNKNFSPHSYLEKITYLHSIINRSLASIISHVPDMENKNKTMWCVYLYSANLCCYYFHFETRYFSSNSE